MLELYADRLKKGLGDRIFALRAEGKPGTLQPIDKMDAGFEVITSAALQQNVGSLKIWIDDNDLKPDVNVLRSAFMMIDEEHSRKLSGGLTLTARRNWARAESDKLLKMLGLLKKNLGRSVGSKSNAVRDLKAAMGSPGKRLKRKTSEASSICSYPPYPGSADDDEEAPESDPRDEDSEEHAESDPGGNLSETEPRSEDEFEEDSNGHSHSSSETASRKPQFKKPAQSQSPGPFKHRKVSAQNERPAPPPAGLLAHTKTFKGGPVDMAENRKAIREKAQERKAKVMRRPASSSTQKTNAVVDNVYKELECMAEFSEEKRPGAAVAKKTIEREKLFFQIKDRKITIGQVTTGQFGSEQGATYTHKRTHDNAHACTRTHTHTRKHTIAGAENMAAVLCKFYNEGCPQELASTHQHAQARTRPCMPVFGPPHARIHARTHLRRSA